MERSGGVAAIVCDATVNQRQPDDNKYNFFAFQGGHLRGQRGNIVQKRFFFFCGKRRDNKILKVDILLSRNFVVIEQAPSKHRATGVLLHLSRDRGMCFGRVTKGQQLQLEQTSEATSFRAPFCCRSSVCHSRKGTLDVASRVPRDEGRRCHCRSFDVS